MGEWRSGPAHHHRWQRISGGRKSLTYSLAAPSARPVCIPLGRCNMHKPARYCGEAGADQYDGRHLRHSNKSRGVPRRRSRQQRPGPPLLSSCLSMFYCPWKRLYRLKQKISQGSDYRYPRTDAGRRSEIYSVDLGSHESG